jgi:signal transduction histidine kinase
VKEVVALGHAEAQRLHRLVDDLGHLLSLEGPAPEGDLYRENVDLAASVRRALRKAARQAPARDRAFDLDAPDPAPIVLADYDKVGIILAHVLSHAAGQAIGEDPIRVSVAGSGEGMGTVRVAYAGAGIGEEELRRAFVKFHRSDAAGESADGDSGLGLHVSRGFAQLMGGTLELHAPTAREVTLVLRLPSASGWAGFARETGR